MWLDAVFDPGVSTRHSSLTRPSHGLRPIREDRHGPKIHFFSELRVRFRATPFTSPHSLFSRIACAIKLYTTGRLTKPFPGRPAILSGSFLLNRQPLPGYPQPSSLRAPSEEIKLPGWQPFVCRSFFWRSFNMQSEQREIQIPPSQ